MELVFFAMELNEVYHLDFLENTLPDKSLAGISFGTRIGIFN